MKKRNSKKDLNKKFNFVSKIISVLLSMSAVLAIAFIIYFEILPLIYLSLIIIIGGVFIIFLIKLMNSKLKKWVRCIFLFLSILLIILFVFISFYSLGTLNMFNDILDLGIRTDNYSIYVTDVKYKNIDDLNDKKIGVLENESEYVENKLSKKIDYKSIEYDNNIEMLNDLKNEELDAVVVLDTNMDLLKESNPDYNNIMSIYTFAITTKVETINKEVDISKDSFVLYLSGIDTNGRVASKARSDVNILAAIDPIEKKILIINTPRDYYVKLSNKNAYDKLTHAGVYGIEESIATLEDLYDTTINYYVRVNFTTFIKIVDALDGIVVDVPKSFCEQTSSRESDEQICLSKGKQTLNGEEALALSRTRHSFADGDRSRIKNQMLVLEALINRAMSPKIITRYTNIISKIGDSVVTNIGDKDVTKLIKNQIEKNDSWNIETYSVDGMDAYKTIYSAGSLNTYVMEPNTESLLIAKDKLKNILN